MRTLLLLLSRAILAAASFETHEIATGLRRGYQLVIHDLNRDGRPDLIALASGLPDLYWYENPGKAAAEWPRHTLASGMNEMINLAVLDGRILLADHFSNNPAKSEGHVYLLTPGADARAPWEKRLIDQLPTSHRFRAMRGFVVNAPLADPRATPPDYRGSIPLVRYAPPEWKRELISDAEQGVMHGIFVQGETLYTASFLGIHAYREGKDGKWTRKEIAQGDPSAWPKSGSSDVAVGRRFTAAIEPWHGHQVALYRVGRPRQVLDASLKEGHTIEIANFDRTRQEQILVGDRGAGGGVFLYRYTGGEWKKTRLDGEAMRASSCAVADLNGDGRPDFACIGGATANLRWYENKGPR